MTYARAFVLLMDAGYTYDEADQMAREISEREQARAEWETAVNRKKASRDAHRRFVLVTAEQIKEELRT